MSQFFLNVDVEHTIGGWARSSYQTALIPCRELDMFLVQRKRCVLCVFVCTCVHVREERGEEKYKILDKQEKNEVFKKKVYIHKENTNYKM